MEKKIQEIRSKINEISENNTKATSSYKNLINIIINDKNLSQKFSLDQEKGSELLQKINAGDIISIDIAKRYAQEITNEKEITSEIQKIANTIQQDNVELRESNKVIIGLLQKEYESMVLEIPYLEKIRNMGNLSQVEIKAIDSVIDAKKFTDIMKVFSTGGQVISQALHLFGQHEVANKAMTFVGGATKLFTGIAACAGNKAAMGMLGISSMAGPLGWAMAGMSILSGLMSFASLFSNEEENRLGEALNQIMEALQFVSKQIENLRKEMHQRFDIIEKLIFETYQDIMKGLKQVNFKLNILIESNKDIKKKLEEGLKYIYSEFRNVNEKLDENQINSIEKETIITPTYIKNLIKNLDEDETNKEDNIKELAGKLYLSGILFLPRQIESALKSDIKEPGYFINTFFQSFTDIKNEDIPPAPELWHEATEVVIKNCKKLIEDNKNKTMNSIANALIKLSQQGANILSGIHALFQPNALKKLFSSMDEKLIAFNKALLDKEGGEQAIKLRRLNSYNSLILEVKKLEYYFSLGVFNYSDNLDFRASFMKMRSYIIDFKNIMNEDILKNSNEEKIENIRVDFHENFASLCLKDSLNGKFNTFDNSLINSINQLVGCSVYFRKAEEIIKTQPIKIQINDSKKTKKQNLELINQSTLSLIDEIRDFFEYKKIESNKIFTKNLKEDIETKNEQDKNIFLKEITEITMPDSAYKITGLVTNQALLDNKGQYGGWRSCDGLIKISHDETNKILKINELKKIINESKTTFIGKHKQNKIRFCYPKENKSSYNTLLPLPIKYEEKIPKIFLDAEDRGFGIILNEYEIEKNNNDFIFVLTTYFKSNDDQLYPLFKIGLKDSKFNLDKNDVLLSWWLGGQFIKGVQGLTSIGGSNEWNFNLFYKLTKNSSNLGVPDNDRTGWMAVFYYNTPVIETIEPHYEDILNENKTSYTKLDNNDKAVSFVKNISENYEQDLKKYQNITPSNIQNTILIKSNEYRLFNSNETQFEDISCKEYFTGKILDLSNKIPEKIQLEKNKFLNFLISLAREKFASRDFIVAAALYKSAIDFFKPDDKFNYAVCLYQLEFYKEALEIFLDLKEQKNPGEVLYYIGNCHLELDDPQKAINCFESSIIIKEKSKEKKSKDYYGYGCALMKLKKYSEAIKKFEDCLKENQNYFQAYFQLSCCYRILGDIDKMILYFEKSIQRMVNNSNENIKENKSEDKKDKDDFEKNSGNDLENNLDKKETINTKYYSNNNRNTFYSNSNYGSNNYNRTWATSEGIYQTLRSQLKDSAEIIHPDTFSISNPLSSEQGFFECVKTLNDYFGSNNQSMLKNKFKKPIVLILNTESLKMSITELNNYVRQGKINEIRGGTHWICCVILPAQYEVGNKKIKNQYQKIIVIDSYGKQTFPKKLKELLISGGSQIIKENTKYSSIRISGFLSEDVKVYENTKFKQQFDGASCGWWAVYNAIKVVETGDTEFLKENQLNDTDVRELYPELDFDETEDLNFKKN